MRLFTAIDIPEEITARLRALVDRVKPTAKMSWSPLVNLHVTTKFIGEWPEARLQEMKDALATVPRPGAVEIAVRGLGWFPHPRNPRVFWAGIESGDELRRLAADTETRLAAMGVPVEDREFHPHLTLARRKTPIPLDALRRVLETMASADFGSFRALSFFLYLSASGRYTKLQEFPLVSNL